MRWSARQIVSKVRWVYMLQWSLCSLTINISLKHHPLHCTMGNCIFRSSAEKVRVIVYGGEELEFKSSIKVRTIISGSYQGYSLVHKTLPYAALPPNTKLEPGEVYYLMPPLSQSSSPKVSSKLANEETCGKKKKLKIVLTRQQLELLLRNSSQLKSKGIAIRLSDGLGNGDCKWHPSLAAIPEVQAFWILHSRLRSACYK